MLYNGFLGIAIVLQACAWIFPSCVSFLFVLTGFALLEHFECATNINFASTIFLQVIMETYTIDFRKSLKEHFPYFLASKMTAYFLYTCSLGLASITCKCNYQGVGELETNLKSILEYSNCKFFHYNLEIDVTE